VITFYLARADNGVLGQGGAIPWRIPGEQRRFRDMTMGKPMIMGRKTFESFPAPLPGRRHIVLTRDPVWAAPGAEVVHTRDEAIALAGDVPEIAVIGGAEIFNIFDDIADAVELTEVHLHPEGNVVIPPFDPPRWREVSREDLETHSFVRLERT
jgi:dihydrofolate reductase